MALLVGFVLVQLARVGVSRGTLSRLRAKIDHLQPKKLEVDQMQRYVEQLRAQEAAFSALARGHGSWSKRLNALSNVTPDGVWFTELILTRDKGLIIQGAAVGQGGVDDMGAVGWLRDRLQADPEFASAVKEIQIESIKRVQDRDIEMVQFTLACTLTDAVAMTP